MADSNTLPSKPIDYANLPPRMSFENWWEDPMAKEFIEDLATLCQEIAAFQLGTLTDPRVADIAALEKYGYVRGSMAILGTSLPLEPLQGPEPAPVAEPAPTERRVGRTRRQMTQKPSGSL